MLDYLFFFIFHIVASLRRSLYQLFSVYHCWLWNSIVYHSVLNCILYMHIWSQGKMERFHFVKWIFSLEAIIGIELSGNYNGSAFHFAFSIWKNLNLVYFGMALIQFYPWSRQSDNKSIRTHTHTHTVTSHIFAKYHRHNYEKGIVSEARSSNIYQMHHLITLWLQMHAYNNTLKTRSTILQQLNPSLAFMEKLVFFFIFRNLRALKEFFIVVFVLKRENFLLFIILN